MSKAITTDSYNIEPFKLNYRAIIPFYILLDPDLSKKELALYGLIEQMESCKGDVFYTNKKLSEILQVSDRAIRQMSEHLQEKSYLVRELKLVTIGKRKTEMHCWNTVKGGVVSEYTGEEVLLPLVALNNTREEAVLPGGEEAVLPGGEEAVLPPCKALVVKAHDINVCGKSHTQLLTSNPNCIKAFEEKFEGYDVTIEELFENCSSYYEGKNISVAKFIQWIKIEHIDNHSKIRRDTPIRKDLSERLKRQEEESIRRATQQLKDYENKVRNIR